MDAVKEIAAGGQPSWEKTYKHPQFGELTFKVLKLPTAQQWLDQSKAQDNLNSGLISLPSGGTSLLSASLAALQTIIECPIIGEERYEDPDNEGHVLIRTTRYNPLAEPDIGFIVGVYSDFWAWRQDLLNRVEEVGKSSGETSGDVSDEQSPSATDSPSTTLAS